MQTSRLFSEQKKYRSNIENYRPVSILPNLSKIYERCMREQMNEYCLNKVLSKWQCEFCEGYSSQYSLLAAKVATTA